MIGLWWFLTIMRPESKVLTYTSYKCMADFSCLCYVGMTEEQAKRLLVDPDCWRSPDGVWCLLKKKESPDGE